MYKLCIKKLSSRFSFPTPFLQQLSQARLANKRKGEEEEEDITANPWDGRYGPEPPEEAMEHLPQGLGLGVHSVQGVVQWEDGGAAAAGGGGSSEAGGGGGGAPKKIRAVIGGGGGGGS